MLLVRKGSDPVYDIIYTKTVLTHTANSLSVHTPRCHSLPLRVGLSGSSTTFSKLQDILFMNVQCIVIL